MTLLNLPSIPSLWNSFLSDAKALIPIIQKNLQEEYNQGYEIFPSLTDIFASFEKCPCNKVKVIILGQDPYHTPQKAHGLSFSVPLGESLPPSLRNIYKEIDRENLAHMNYKNGDLSAWAGQGILLLNTVLTVRSGDPHSHARIGWEKFSDSVISELSQQKSNLVFVLWGNFARKKRVLINTKKHLVLESAHPSPFSAHKGFFKNEHFSRINKFLIKTNQIPIVWQNKIVQSQNMFAEF